MYQCFSKRIYIKFRYTVRRVAFWVPSQIDKSESPGVGPRNLHFSPVTTYLEILIHGFKDSTLSLSLSLSSSTLVIDPFYSLLLAAFSFITLEISP